MKFLGSRQHQTHRKNSNVRFRVMFSYVASRYNRNNWKKITLIGCHLCGSFLWFLRWFAEALGLYVMHLGNEISIMGSGSGPIRQTKFLVCLIWQNDATPPNRNQKHSFFLKKLEYAYFLLWQLIKDTIYVRYLCWSPCNNSVSFNYSRQSHMFYMTFGNGSKISRRGIATMGKESQSV